LLSTAATATLPNRDDARKSGFAMVIEAITVIIMPWKLKNNKIVFRT
jgi:cytosine/uracil/thiamine/allantoin permease